MKLKKHILNYRLEEIYIKNTFPRAKLYAYLVIMFALLTSGLISPELSEAQNLNDLSPSQQKLLQNMPQDQREKLLEKYSQKQQAEDRDQGAQEREEVKERREKISQKAEQMYETRSPIEQRLRQRLQSPTDREGQVPSVFQQDLRQFGYALFRGPPSTFAPLDQIPMPTTHILGPGDTIKVQLYGKKNARYSMKVDRNGQIDFPEIGPLNVGGQNFEEVKELIQKQVSNQFIGVETSITLGKLRSIQVFILGDVVAPGSYTVSSLSSLTNALLASGGVKRIGSLRDITLKRDGEVVTEFDLYNLLLKGETKQDIRLRPGDVILVPPIGPTVGIVGEVLRPAIYELDDSATIEELIELAGGLNPSADSAHVQVNRRTSSGTQTVEDLNLKHEEARQKSVRDGDVIQVYNAPEQANKVVFLKGHFKRPGSKEWKPGMRLTDIVNSVEEDLLSTPDLEYVIIKREVGPRRKTKAFSVDLGAALKKPESENNVRIQPRDTVYVFSTTGNRTELLQPTIQELRDQSRHDRPPKVVSIRGNVRHPGTYPWEPGMEIRDLIQASLDIRADTDMNYALVKRTNVKKGCFSVQLGKALQDPASEENAALQPNDELLVFPDATIAGKQAEESQEITAKGISQTSTQEQAQAETEQSKTEQAEQVAAEEGITRSQVKKRANEQGISPEKAAKALAREKGLSQEDLQQTTREKETDQQEQEESEEKEELAQREISTRRNLIDPVVQELYQQAKKGYPAQVVRVQGKIRIPGEYPLEKDMRVSDLIRAGNGLQESAYSLQAELTRYKVHEGKYREVSHRSVDLAKIYQGNNKANIKLRPHDRLYIQKIPQWEEPSRIEVRGEVRFPGTYSISRGDTMTEVIERAGGLSKRAYPQGAVFIREDLQEKEQERMDRMTQRLEKDLATISLAEIQQEPKAAQGYSALQNMLDQLSATNAVGRLTLDLPAMLAGKAQDVTLQDGDELYIPSKPQEVTVMGEVQFSTSHLYKNGMDYEDYIQKCGGTTSRADQDRTYIIHASGEVEIADSGWFSASTSVNPGDTIVVPLNVDYIKPLDLVSNVSQILYQLGMAAASWKTVSGI